RAVDESRAGGMGRRQQSLPPGCGEGKHRSGRHRRDHRETGRRAQRPVGSNGPFGEHAELPKNLGQDGGKRAAKKPATRAREISPQADKAADRKASQAYERERQRCEHKEAGEEADRQNERARRQKAVDKAQAAVEKAEEEHARREAALRPKSRRSRP